MNKKVNNVPERILGYERNARKATCHCCGREILPQQGIVCGHSARGGRNIALGVMGYGSPCNCAVEMPDTNAPVEVTGTINAHNWLCKVTATYVAPRRLIPEDIGELSDIECVKRHSVGLTTDIVCSASRSLKPLAKLASEMYRLYVSGHIKSGVINISLRSEKNAQAVDYVINMSTWETLCALTENKAVAAIGYAQEHNLSLRQLLDKLNEEGEEE